MVQKKSAKSNLENKRSLFFEYGMAVALACMLLAFEWGTNEQALKDLDFSGQEEFIPEEVVIITKPEPPKPKPPIIPDEVIVIDDDDPIIDEPDIDWGQDIDADDAFDLTFWEETDEPDAGPEIFVRVEKMPSYKGGDQSKFQKELQQLVKYPLKAQELDIQGNVIVKFVVNEEGQLVDPEILRSADDLLTDAVLIALKKTGKWKAGEQRGRKVKVTFTVPVFFRLQN